MTDQPDARGDGARTRLHESIDAHVLGLATWGVRYLRGAAHRAPAAAAPQAAAGDPSPPRASMQGTLIAGRALPPGSAARPIAERGALLEAMAREVAACTRCRLAPSRTKTVFGVGSRTPRLMFVGEAPGHDEDIQGEPFVGRAGQLLDRIIAAMGLRREEVYIANILKCRPPENRAPLPDEVACCTPYLVRQIEILAPALLVALGRPAANFLLRSTAALGALRGKRHDYDGIPVIVTYHPAYLLRNPAAKGAAWADIQDAMRFLGLPIPVPPAAPAAPSDRPPC